MSASELEELVLMTTPTTTNNRMSLFEPTNMRNDFLYILHQLTPSNLKLTPDSLTSLYCTIDWATLVLVGTSFLGGRCLTYLNFTCNTKLC
jgi:hypothetical protein